MNADSQVFCQVSVQFDSVQSPTLFYQVVGQCAFAGAYLYHVILNLGIDDIDYPLDDSLIVKEILAKAFPGRVLEFVVTLLVAQCGVTPIDPSFVGLCLVFG